MFFFLDLNFVKKTSDSVKSIICIVKSNVGKLFCNKLISRRQSSGFATVSTTF